jgi:hypothetical protein
MVKRLTMPCTGSAGNGACLPVMAALGARNEVTTSCIRSGLARPGTGICRKENIPHKEEYR